MAEQLYQRSGRDIVHSQVLADRRAVVGSVILDHRSLRIARASPGKMEVEDRTPNTNPPVMAATFVIFIVAGTTRAAQVLVRNGLVSKLCITNWAHEPFLSPSVAAPMLRRKKVVCGARRW